MTYWDLCKATEAKKQEVLKKFGKDLKGPGGFLVQAEIERDPGMVAYLWLAKDFCETLADHIGEWVEELEAIGDTATAREISDIYMGYEDGRHDLYDILPVEAQLWD